MVWLTAKTFWKTSKSASLSLAIKVLYTTGTFEVVVVQDEPFEGVVLGEGVADPEEPQAGDAVVVEVQDLQVECPLEEQRGEDERPLVLCANR